MDWTSSLDLKVGLRGQTEKYGTVGKRKRVSGDSPGRNKSMAPPSSRVPTLLREKKGEVSESEPLNQQGALTEEVPKVSNQPESPPSPRMVS